jgi:uncharacterized membrane protein YidH (DUF202 family)
MHAAATEDPERAELLTADESERTKLLAADEGGARECRICCSSEPPLESLCGCKGSIQWVHHHCVQRWITEKGDSRCELCKERFTGDFEVPPPPRNALPWSHPGNAAALLALSLRYADASERAAYQYRRTSLWVIGGLTAIGLVILQQAVAVSETADKQNKAFYSTLLKAALILAPVACVLHALAAARRRRAEAEQQVLTTQMAIALGTMASQTQLLGGEEDVSGVSADADGLAHPQLLPLALLAHAAERNLNNARPRIGDVALHSMLQEVRDCFFTCGYGSWTE